MSKKRKFFDIVQYTGTGSTQAINHSLGSTPGCIIVKCTNASGISWVVYHKGLNGGTTPEQYAIILNTTAAQSSNSVFWNNTAPTSTQFTVGTAGGTNTSGNTYIAYIFADQAGGFGATGTDSAIACGSYTATGNDFINLGWEPQFILIKNTTSVSNWTTVDVMRGESQTILNYLRPNTTVSELTYTPGYYIPTATGFSNPGSLPFDNPGDNIIYIAIRRPNKPPTTGTSVFSPVTNTVSSSAAVTTTTGFPVDTLFFEGYLNDGTNFDIDRLRGSSSTSTNWLQTNSTAAEQASSGSYGIALDSNTSITDNHFAYNVAGTDSFIYWALKRAPTFFDEVCYTGTGANQTIKHNLTTVPQIIILKDRSNAGNNWVAYCQPNGTSYNSANSNVGYLNSNISFFSYPTVFNSTAPTSTQITLGNTTLANVSAHTYVGYLFGTCAGISYVGTYTGSGTGQSIACGFGSGGARFILIKRTDSTGDWYWFDSARGLTSSSSPYLLWNSSGVQVSGNNGCYASSGGFTLTSSASATVNVNGGSYIFLAVA